MRHLFVAAIASLGVLGFLATDSAKAQALRPYGTPAVSPYINLLRPGINPAVNYYGSVRPQLQYNTAINSLEQQVQASRVAMTAAESQAVPSTGHPIYFMNYQRYFLNTGAVSPFQNTAATTAIGGTGSMSNAGQRATSNIISGATTPSRRY
jgi:uncharacterized protein YqkB